MMAGAYLQLRRGNRVGKLLFVLFLWTTSLPAQQRGMKVITHTPDGAILELYDNSWAVVIGVNQYEEWPRLQYAVPDAQAVRNKLVQLGFPSQNIFFLRDAQATKERIELILGDELRRKVGENDRVFIYFAGHGQTENLPEGKQEGYIVPVDGDKSNLFSTCISMTLVRQFSQRMAAKHVFYAIDACYSGLALMRTGALDTKDRQYLQKVARFPARQIVTAGSAGEQVVEQGGHGAFTRTLLIALDGSADRYPPFGVLTGSELGNYLQPTVSLETNNEQTPQFGRLAAGEGEFMFVLPEVSRVGTTVPPPTPITPAPPAAVQFGHLQVNVNAAHSQVFVDEVHRGTANPGRELNLPNVGLGQVTVRVTANGYQAKQQTFMLMENAWTQAVVKLMPVVVAPPPAPVVHSPSEPDFRIIVHDYDDGRFYKGNQPDGRIEAGEVVQIVVNVQNLGRDAEGVGLHVENLNREDVSYIRNLDGDSDRSFMLGGLAFGENRDIEFYFFTSPLYDHQEVAFSLAVVEAHKGVVRRDTLIFELGQSISTEDVLIVDSLQESPMLSQVGEVPSSPHVTSAGSDGGIGGVSPGAPESAPVKRGAVTVTADRKNTRVFVNGNFKGTIGPNRSLFLRDLPYGWLKISATDDNNRMITYNKQIRAENEQVDFRFGPKTQPPIGFVEFVAIAILAAGVSILAF